MPAYRSSLRPRITCISRRRAANPSPERPLMAVAHRMYARALYEAARDQGTVDVVRSELSGLAGAMEATPELEAFLTNPQLDPGAKASVLDEVTSGADPTVRNFVR